MNGRNESEESRGLDLRFVRVREATFLWTKKRLKNTLKKGLGGFENGL